MRVLTQLEPWVDWQPGCHCAFKPTEARAKESGNLVATRTLI